MEEQAMGTAFWVKRYVVVLAIAFAIIVIGQLVQQRTLEHALFEGAIWAPLAAAIFIAVRIVRARRGDACALCNDIPQAKEVRNGTEARS
jgi:hypothetical protein